VECGVKREMAAVPLTAGPGAVAAGSMAPMTNAGRGITNWLERFGPLFALIALCVASALKSDDFLKPQNLINILQQWSAVGIVAMGMTLVIGAGGIDLSVGSMLALVGGAGLIAVDSAAEAGAPPFICFIAGVGVMLVGGAALGAVNGSLVTLARIPPFIATLGGMAAFRSLIQMKADGASINAASSVMTDYLDSGITLSFLKVGATADRPGDPLVIPWGVALLALTVVVFWLLSSRTTLGVYVRAVGDNELAARYSAVKVGWVRFSTYVMLGVCCGVGAAISAARLNSVSSSAGGVLLELDAIAAVVIGGTRMSGGNTRILGTLCGVLLLGVVGNMLNLIGVGTYAQGLVKAAIIIGAVLIQRGTRG